MPADKLMTSLSTALKDRASGILLSGIGEDGIAGDWSDSKPPAATHCAGPEYLPVQ
jgi:hypothetical protein